MTPDTIRSLSEFQRRPLSLTATGDTTQYLLDSQVKPKTVFIVTRIAVENQTSAFTKLRFGTYKTGVFFPVEEVENPAEDALYNMIEELYAFPGEQVGIEIVGATSGDIIRAYIEGFKKTLEE